MTNYDKLVRDFTARTECNLVVINNIANKNKKADGFTSDFIKDLEEKGAYEVTQLINSLLGIIVLPHERVIKKIKEANIQLSTLTQEGGWPHLAKMKGDPPLTSLGEFIRNMRHSVGHFNLQFVPSASDEIVGIEVCNVYEGQLHWTTRFDVDDLGKLVTQLAKQWKKYEDGVAPCDQGFALIKWVSENTITVSENVGFELTKPVLNYQIGTFKAQLVLEDQDGEKVVVQARLGKSSHEELGKLLTFSHALNSKKALWMVEKARQEHVELIEKVNLSYPTKIYLIQIEVNNNDVVLKSVVSPN